MNTCFDKTHRIGEKSIADGGKTHYESKSITRRHVHFANRIFIRKFKQFNGKIQRRVTPLIAIT